MGKEKSDLFKALDSINLKYKPPNKIPNSYILSLWLAQDKYLIDYVQDINPYIFSINNSVAFWYYFKKIPKRKRFIKWTKKEERKNSKEVQELMRKYNISEKEAKLSLE